MPSGRLPSAPEIVGKLPHDVLAELAAQLCSQSTALQATTAECLAAHKPLPLWAVERVLLSPDLVPHHILGLLVAEDAVAASAACSQWLAGWKATNASPLLKGRCRLRMQHPPRPAVPGVSQPHQPAGDADSSEAGGPDPSSTPPPPRHHPVGPVPHPPRPAGPRCRPSLRRTVTYNGAQRAQPAQDKHWRGAAMARGLE